MLSVDLLSVSYGAIRAVREVSLRVEEGEIVALLGPNGAGKTSLISAVIGLVPVASGKVMLGDVDITRKKPEDIVRLGVTMTPEGRHIFGDLTVDENLRLGAAVRKDKAGVKKDLDELLAMFPILQERYNSRAQTLSGGEQQQLAIVRAMMSRPKLLMLDEPSLGLAPQLVEQIFQLISTLRDRGVTLLVVEQNAHEALLFADRAYVLSTGQIRFEGAAGELAGSEDLMAHYLGIGAETGAPDAADAAKV